MNQQSEDWIPVKGETVFVFQHKTRRIKKAVVKYFTGTGTVMIDTPINQRGAYNLDITGRTPEEVLRKTLKRSRVELVEKQSLVKFLEKKLSD